VSTNPNFLDIFFECGHDLDMKIEGREDNRGFY